MIEIFVAVLGGIILQGIIDENMKENLRRELNYERDRRRELNYELNRREDKAFNIFNERKNQLMTSFSNKLVEDFSNNVDFCRQEMDIEYNNYILEINKYIDKISEIENKDNLYSSHINHSIENLAQKFGNFEVNHLNILLIGPSGVGKSCLINSILKLEDEKMAKSEMTKPTTKTFNVYESNKIPNLRLIDSRGIEKGDYDVKTFVKEITNYVEAQQLNGNPDNFIHCIWYCITGNRFEDIEEETLKVLSSIYDDAKLPIIVVYTQAIIPAYYNGIKKEIEKINKNFEYIPVIAKDIISDNFAFKQKNIDLLVSKSLDKAKNAVYSSVFSSLRKKVKTDTNFEIEQSLAIIKKDLNEYISSTKEITSNKEFNEEDYYNNIFRSLLYGKNTKKDLKEETKKTIKELTDNFRNKNEEILGKCLKDFIEQKSYELSNKLLEIQSEVNRENDGNLKVLESRSDFQEKSKENIYDIIIEVAKKIYFFNNIKSLPPKLVDLISYKIKKEFLGVINNESTNNIINKNIRRQFEKILSGIKKFLF